MDIHGLLTQSIYPTSTTITPLEDVTAEKRFDFIVEGLEHDIAQSIRGEPVESAAGYIVLEETQRHLTDMKPNIPEP
ncbi:MAG TPA: hypothetical protein VE548_01300 [Nitrososphaeraceae archaeon]|jgi:hypothetical protein|nr:hypothetical protein [Nitrososphaeraceae archaeon]